MNKIKTRLNYILCLIFVVLYALLKTDIILYSFFVISIVNEFIYIAKKDYLSIISNILLLLPLIGILNIAKIPLLNIYIAIFSIFYLLTNKINNKVAFMYSMFIIFDFLKFAVFNSNITSVISYINTIILYLAILACIITKINLNNLVVIKKISYSFVNGTFLSILFGFITRLISNGLVFAIVNNNILTRNSGASGDPNYFGLYICISISIIIVNNILKNKLKAKDLIAILLYGVMGLTSSSRMYIVILGLLIITTIAIYLKKIFSKNIIKALIIILIMIIIFLIIYPYIDNNIEYIFKRLEDRDVTNGRSTLIKEYSEYINNDIVKTIFGIGIPQYNIRAGLGHYAHNYYIEIYVTQGLIGISFIIITLIINLRKNNINFKIEKILPIMIFLIGGLGINYIEVESFYILLALLISNLECKEEINE